LKAQIAVLERELRMAKSVNAGPVQEVSQEDFSTMPVLGYWDIRGLGAPCRMLLYYCKVNFADVTYSLGEAPEYSRAAFHDIKDTLGLELPNLPYLIDGEVRLSETAAILQYIAKKWRPALLGTTAAEMGRIHMLWYYVLDLKTKSTTPCYTDGNVEAIIETVRPLLARLVGLMGDKQYLCGDNLTWLDFYFAENVDMLHKLTDGLFYAEFPTLQAYWERFICQDNLAEAWADDSKLMKMPFNNKAAKLLQNKEA